MKADISRILTVTDFTEISGHALGLAEKTASSLGVPIHLLHVMEIPGGAALDKEGHWVGDEDADMDAWNARKAKAQSFLMELEKTHPLVSGWTMKEGALTEKILETAAEIDAGLICMGTHGTQGLRDWVTSSECSTLVGRSTIPVMSLKCDRSDLIVQNILVVLDEGRLAPASVERLRTLQRAFGAVLHLLRVIPEGKPESDARQELEQAAKDYGFPEALLHVHPDSRPERGVLHFLQEKQMDLLCVSAKARKGFLDSFKGDLARDVVNHFHKPILALPTEEK